MKVEAREAAIDEVVCHGPRKGYLKKENQCRFVHKAKRLEALSNL
jgi:hypothetical protein